MSLTRRTFLAASAATTLGAARLIAADAPRADAQLDVAFFLVGDTHYLAHRDDPAKMDAVSVATNSGLIDQLNQLPGAAIPDAAGGGVVAAPRGLIHAGDLIDTGDKTGAMNEAMQRTEWAAWQADYGISGKEGRLKMPVCELWGNHDAPGGKGLVIDGIADRNKRRPGLANLSPNGLHYSWDWGSVHFVHLGIVVGSVQEVVRKRRYDPKESLAFLIADLAEKVGTSGRPVVLTHHVDMARYSTPPMPDAPATTAEWDPADVRGYYDALKAYNVAAILYGHTHARNIYRWNGTPQKGEAGVPVYNVDNSGHFNSQAQALFYFHFSGEELIVREVATADRWETATWTPQVWRRKIAAGKVGS